MDQEYPNGEYTSTSLAVPQSAHKLTGLASPSQSFSSSAVPQLDLGYDRLKARMDSFLVSFDRYIAQGRQTILESRNNHSKTIIELRGAYETGGKGT